MTRPIDYDYEQMVLWMEWVPDESITSGGRFKLADLVKQPDRIWTLLSPGDRQRPPSLPIMPVHNNNAFLEDRSHDWHWQRGKLRYFSRVADRHVWLLVEYKKSR